MINCSNEYVLIENVREENILKCVEARRINQASFFGKRVSDAESEQWIRLHSTTSNDILLEIIFRPLDFFIGTIGFTKQDKRVEIGRLSIYPPAIKELIRTGIVYQKLHNIMKVAIELLIDYLFKNTDAEVLFCNVFPNNIYSNSLCAHFIGSSQKIQLEIEGVYIDVLYYEMTREEYLSAR